MGILSPIAAKVAAGLAGLCLVLAATVGLQTCRLGDAQERIGELQVAATSASECADKLEALGLEIGELRAGCAKQAKDAEQAAEQAGEAAGEALREVAPGSGPEAMNTFWAALRGR